MLPLERSETCFSDFKTAYTRAQALVEANRCLFCEGAPCVQACPTEIDIPQFIRKIATGNLQGSAQTIFAQNILGMSCARVCPVEVLCAGACVLHRLGVAPIEIGKLQRYTTDAALAAGWRFAQAGADSGWSVGLVGGGPASLACAHELRRLGHACTVYERRTVLGGLNTWGVAPYKIRADRVLEEVAWVLGVGGIKVQTGIEVGRDVSWTDLEARHDAIFVGVGLGADQLPELPGIELQGVRGAIDFIEALKLGTVDLGGVTHAVVIGGGNTAIDAVRAPIGLGVAQVTMLYRRDEASMPGYQHEWAAARQAGAQAIWRAIPLAFLGEGGRLRQIRCQRVDAERSPIDGSEFTVPAELALIAIGQSKRAALLKQAGLRLEGGRPVTDSAGRCDRSGYYTGGDCANGAKEVVNAAAEGRDAARAIDEDLRRGLSLHSQPDSGGA